MDIESIRDFCRTLPCVSEYFPFPTYPSMLAFRVLDKIFVLTDLDNLSWFVLKCDPDYAIDLRDHYEQITGAWHMNKKYWNQVDIRGDLSDQMIMDLIRNSYAEVVKKFSQRVKTEHPEILNVVAISRY